MNRVADVTVKIKKIYIYLNTRKKNQNRITKRGDGDDTVRHYLPKSRLSPRPRVDTLFADDVVWLLQGGEPNKGKTIRSGEGEGRTSPKNPKSPRQFSSAVFFLTNNGSAHIVIIIMIKRVIVGTLRCIITTIIND